MFSYMYMKAVPFATCAYPQYNMCDVHVHEKHHDVMHVHVYKLASLPFRPLLMLASTCMSVYIHILNVRCMRF